MRIGLSSAACAAALGTLAALGLSRIEGMARYLLFTLMLSPLLMPNIIYALGIYKAYSSLGLISTETGLALAHSDLGMPYVMITVSAALSDRDAQLALAARSLGAGPVAAFSLVRFRMIRRIVLDGALLAFIASFDEVVIAIFVSRARDDFAEDDVGWRDQRGQSDNLGSLCLDDRGVNYADSRLGNRER